MGTVNVPLYCKLNIGNNMSYSNLMSAARNGDYNYDPNRRSRSRAQAKRLRTTSSSSSSAWDQVADVRNTIQQQAVGYNYIDTTVVVEEDPYADLRDCMI